MEVESAFIILFCVATAVAIVVRRYQAPYTVALVVTGLGIGALGILEAPHLTKGLLFAVFLPGLLFEAAFQLDAARVRENIRTILALAVPGVVAAIGLTAALTTLVVRDWASTRPSRSPTGWSSVPWSRPPTRSRSWPSSARSGCPAGSRCWSKARAC